MLVGRQDLHPELSIVRVRPDQGPAPSFRPGQFVTIGLLNAPAGHSPPKLALRPYSVTSAPDKREDVELYVNLVREGALTPRLWTIHEGGRLYLKPTVGGTFTLDEVPNGKDLVMVATGTGLGPYISMLRHFRGKDRWRKFVIIHGVRNVADLGYRGEIEAAAKTDANLLYLPTVTREDWPGLQGRIQDVLFTDLYPQCVGAPLSPEQCHIFLCGNPVMVEAVESELVARGFRKHKRREPGATFTKKPIGDPRNAFMNTPIVETPRTETQCPGR